MNNTSIIALDGRFLYYAFIAGSRNILEHQSEINKINIFPVKDNDTGTNLVSTLRSVFYSIKPSKSYKSTLNDISKATLLGARGNSGLIFAQFLYGINSFTEDVSTISVPQFIQTIIKSVPFVYNSIANPVEGTMLTIMREWSEFLALHQEKIDSFQELFLQSIDVLHRSLQETKSLLPDKFRNKYVDAGAKGLVLFVEGIISLITDGKIHHLHVPTVAQIPEEKKETSAETVKYRYCVEAILVKNEKSKRELKDYLSKWGNSIVIAGASPFCRIHLHTNQPDRLVQSLQLLGIVTYQKVDDMQKQNEISSNRKWDIALVTDSTCDLSQELIDKYQIHVLPMNLYLGERHYLDKLTLNPSRFYDLLRIHHSFPKSSQINEQSFVNLYSYLSSKYKTIISLHITDKFSGTYLNSLMASRKVNYETGVPIHVIDSSNLSGGLGLLVMKTALSIERGDDVEEILKNIELWKKEISIFVSVKTLKYMQKGGRVPRKLLNLTSSVGINPIVSMSEDGKAKLFGVSLGQNNNMNRVIHHIKHLSKDKQLWNYIVLHAHNKDGAVVYQQKMEHLFHKEPLSVVDISPVVGMNAGPGAVAVSVLFE